MRTNIGLILASLVGSVYSRLSTHEVTSPQFDFSDSNNQQIAFLGDFDATSTYKYIGESNFTNQNNLRNQLYYTSGDNDQFITLGEISGEINDIIPLRTDSYVLVGDFQSIGEQDVSSPAIFNTTSEEFTSIDNDNDINGTITTAFYDSDDSLIYFGGNFEFNNTHGAAIYNLTTQQFNSTLFHGFGENGTVSSILKLGSSIIFGGDFTTLGLRELLTNSYNTSNISVTTDQVVSLKYAQFSSSDDSSSPESLVCPESSNEWSINGVSAATVNINLPYQVIPSKIRIYNSKDQDSQVSLFRLLTSPANGIMNLTYIDPDTGDLAYCDAWCPLLNSSRLESVDDIEPIGFGDSSLRLSSSYQEFGFINSLDVGGLTFEARESYGSNIALAGFQIFQSTYSTYANNTLNEPSCDINEYSRAVTQGEWTSSSNGDYLVSEVDVSNGIPDDVGVTFYPNITYAGEYSILLYTPGCGADQTCSTRGITNATVYDDETNEILDTNLIYQSNQEEKYDLVYYGHLNSTPRVELKLDSPGPQGSTVTFVADKIDVNVYEIDDIVNANGTIPLNGIFEFSPGNFSSFDASNITDQHYIGNTTINRLGGSITNHTNLHLAVLNESLYVGGNFSSRYGDNLVRLDYNEQNNETNGINVTIHDVNGGLDGQVNNLKVVDDSLIILGDFNNTNNDSSISSLDGSDSNSLDQVALYNGSWYSFGRSFEASRVNNITLENTEYLAFDEHNWVSDNETWYDNNQKLSFNVSSSANNGNSTVFVGSLKKSDAIGNKGTFITQDNNQTNITNEALVESVFNTGLYVNESFSIFGGQFNTSENARNLIFISNNETSSIDVSWNSNASVTKLFAVDDKLFVGTHDGGSVEDHDFDGVFFYHLNNRSFASPQPDGLTKESDVPQVNELGFLNNTYLVVGGDFDGAGSVSCSGLCFYNLNNTQWESLIDSFSGDVKAFRFINETIIVVAGDLELDDHQRKLITYDFNSTDNQQPDHFDDLDEIVENFILVDNSTDGRIIVSGPNYIRAYDGSQWNFIDSDLNNSTIKDISLLNVSDSNNNNNGSYFDSNNVLVASGHLNITGFGYANVAHFNGTHWIPYLIATHQNSTASIDSIFLNKDISSLYISGTMTNSSQSSTSSSSPSSSSGSDGQRQGSHHMKRGYIVLIGLALAVGTMSLIGLIAAFFIFKKRGHQYTPLEPRVNETEMLDTVPPENLLRHV
ncbi:Bud site selection protein [Wickerhamomyces ciferrii]|uniref:Bud site selection protein n=1 Tax=Wickerhamomyces ciferrii (strain ATCC 14091 / BCRC 22168 / CBS 111 / JCM 3599 / NBRC 0793 / NRRL Y-1031 F-60-10) TaxID=1206466 RepID=K0K9E3_WICCF|nr:Bud site selection protein [Wickerhamomyces ciferrii]CCH41530.1 Bud site selection protein [Wickerhamomyces ciferrii]